MKINSITTKIIGVICLSQVLLGSKCEFIALEAKPETICEGDPVELTWEAKGVKNLSFSTNPGMDLGLPSSPGNVGSVTINPVSSIRVTLTGETNSATKSDWKEIRVIRRGESDIKRLNFEWGGCIGENANKYESLNDLSLGGSLEVQGFTNQSDRHIRVTHESRVIELLGGDTTNGFNGTSPGGEWSIELLDLNTAGIENEGCPPEERTAGIIYNAPPTIGVGVTYGCR